MTRTAVQPRLLNKADAASYCGVSEPVFERVVDVRPICLGGPRLARYDRLDLDAWIDRRKGGTSTLSADDWLSRVGDDGRAG